MALNPISGFQGPSNLQPSPRPAGSPAGGPTFADLLQQKQQTSGDSGVQLSRHAQKRVDRRDLDLDSAKMARLDSAITRAAEKGSKNSVVMLDNLALVVDVRQRTVVTAMSRANSTSADEGGQRVFTNIDSVVIA